MTFRGLEDRFKHNMSTLYGKYSTRDAKDGVRGNEPYIEVKPDDKNKIDYSLDDPKTPIRSIATDLKRLKKWSKSKSGITFYLNQAILQTGNAFSETRIYNPASVLLNTQPFHHFKRSFVVASDIGVEGRLQKESSTSTIHSVLSGKSNNSILKYLPPLGISIDGVSVDLTGIGSGILNIANGGSLKKNQRPETLLGKSNGDYFSVYMWKAYQKLISEYIRDQTLSTILGVRIGKNKKYSLHRYFIKSNNENTTKKYLKGDTVRLWSDRYNPEDFSLINEEFGNTSMTSHFGITNDESILSYLPSQFQIISDNNVEDNLSFPNSSIRETYKNEYMRDVVRNSINNWLDRNNKLPSSPFKGGISLNYLREVDVNTSSTQRFSGVKVDSKNRKKYFFDPINSADNVKFISSTEEVTMDMMRQSSGERGNLIDLIFFDVRNKIGIPFRAFLRNIQEQVHPQFNETNYIGRIERNITYSSVRRDLNFGLTVHAFNEEELQSIWKKLNYLSGMAYPSGYDNGYMIPPFIKLTMGDLYNNQPAIIKSMNMTIEDDTSWEITPGFQVPHGVHLNITLSLLEKSVMQSMLPENEGKRLLQFYPVGNRTTDLVVTDVPTAETTSTTSNEKNLPAILRGVSSQSPLSGVNTSNDIGLDVSQIPVVTF